MDKVKCREDIRKIAADFKNSSERVKHSLNGAIERLSKDLYNKDTHFILELIQNAEDNKYGANKPLISFYLTKADPTKTKKSDGALIIQNNENGFLYENVDAICDVNATTKNKLEGYGYIGEKGIGFKSVFLITSCPYIVSNGYSFSLPEKDEETGFGYIVPNWWDNPEQFEKYHGTTIILPLDKEGYNYEKIETMLEKIEAMTILFLSRIKEIKIETDSGSKFSITKDDMELPKVQLIIDGNTRDGIFQKETRNFMFFSEIYERPNDIKQENRDGIKNRDVIIAYPLDHENEMTGRVFAYLPTNLNTGFPFLINADFIPTSGRSELKGIEEKNSCPWNEWLWKCIASCTKNSLLPLAKDDLLTVERLNALVSPINNVDKDDYLYPFFLEIKDAFKEQSLFKTDTGFSKADEALILGASELLELFYTQEVTFSLFNRRHWLNKKITNSNKPLSGLYSFLHDKDKLNIPDIDFSYFFYKITNVFLLQQSDDWIVKFYRILAKRTSIEIANVKTKPIIRAINSGKQDHIIPFVNNEPNVYLCYDATIEVPAAIVKPGIIIDDDVKNFLKEGLKIPEWKDLENVILNIIPKYQEDKTEVSIDEHLVDLQKISRAYNTSTPDEKSRLKSKLADASFILSENINGESIGYRKPVEVYFKNENLEIYFAFNQLVGFVSREYNVSYMSLFKEIGVENSIRIKKKEADYQNNVAVIDSNGRHKRGLNNYDPDIDIDGLQQNLIFFNNNTDSSPIVKEKMRSFSIFLWNTIAVSYADCIRGTIEEPSKQSNKYSEKIDDISKFGKMLINTPWLPNTAGYFNKPGEIKFSELPEGFREDAKLIRMLGMKQDLIAQLAAKAGILMEDLEFIKNNAEAFKKWKIDTENLQMATATFPDKVSKNPEFREKRIKEIAEEEDKRIKIKVERTETITGDEKTRAREYLLDIYKDDNNVMRCQICGNGDIKESPFKTNGYWHFEAYPFLPSLREKLHRANFLALCHNHAAMFSLVANEEKERIENVILERKANDELFIEINLIGQNRKIWFTPDHLNDLKAILEQSKNGASK